VPVVDPLALVPNVVLGVVLVPYVVLGVLVELLKPP
jgi:hypothetical protein